MLRFDIPDMTCGHCAQTITKAIRSVDANADVAVDVAAREVKVAATQVDAAALKAVIESAGYTPSVKSV